MRAGMRVSTHPSSQLHPQRPTQPTTASSVCSGYTRQSHETRCDVRSVARLDELVDHATRRCFRLGLLVGETRLPLTPEGSRSISFVSIELLNLWGEFCRAYYVSCALRAKDRTNARVVHTHSAIKSNTDAIALAVRTTRPKTRKQTIFTHRDEPTWHNKSEFHKVMRALAPSNLADIDAALSQSNTVLNSLPTFRNFFAHRSESTAQKAQRLARQYRVSPRQHPAMILATFPPGRPQTLILDYVDELRLIIDAF